MSTNGLISLVVRILSRKAGPTSQTGYQRNLFSMLSFLYLINTSITPLLVATLESFRTSHIRFDEARFSTGSEGALGDSRLIYQLWYDASGIVSSMVFNLVSIAFTFGFSQTVPAVQLLKRYILARGATSQHKLNDLWRPPRMDLGKNYAKLFKAMSLVIIYAPLYPPMYPLAALYLLISYVSTRFGVSYWFAQPAKMNETVSNHMRGWLAGSMFISLVIKRFIMNRSTADIPLYLSG